jgi:hypothetical protein
METWTYISLYVIQQESSTSSMDMHYGDMDMHHGYAAWICSMNKQNARAAWRHGHTSRTCSMNKQQGQAAWTNSMDTQHRKAAWICRRKMRHGDIDMRLG